MSEVGSVSGVVDSSGGFASARLIACILAVHRCSASVANWTKTFTVAGLDNGALGRERRYRVLPIIANVHSIARAMRTYPRVPWLIPLTNASPATRRVNAHGTASSTDRSRPIA